MTRRTTTHALMCLVLLAAGLAPVASAANAPSPAPHARAAPLDALPRIDVHTGADTSNTTAYANAVAAAVEHEVRQDTELANDLVRDPSHERALQGARDSASRAQGLYHRTLGALPGIVGDACNSMASTARELAGDLGEPLAALAHTAGSLVVDAYHAARALPGEAYALALFAAALAQDRAEWAIDTARQLVP